MTDDINFKNNPLHGVGLKKMLLELSDHYGFEILFAYLNINCFKNNPSIQSSAKFLAKTDWAREKVEGFYLYTYKSLPEPTYLQKQLGPRDRIIPDDQAVGEPAELNLEEAQQLREQREAKAAEFDSKKRTAKHQHTDQSSRRSNGRDNNDARKNNRKSPSLNNTDKPDLNPWGNPWT